jgi:hypothetical protein
MPRRGRRLRHSRRLYGDLGDLRGRPRPEQHSLPGRQCLYADGYVPSRRMYRLQSCHVSGGRPVPDRRNVPAGYRNLLQPDAGARGRKLQRRERLHADRHLPERNLYRIQSSDVSGRGPMSDRGDVPAGYRNVLASDAGGEWHELRRRERVHPVGHVPERNLYRIQPSHMSGRGPVSDRGDVPADYRNVLATDGGPEWHELQRRERVHPDGHLPERNLYRIQPSDMSSRGAVSNRGDVPADYRNVLTPDAGREWHELQRLERVHPDGHLPERSVYGIQPSHMSGRGAVSDRGDVPASYRNLLQPDASAKRYELHRRERLHADRHLPERNLHRIQPSHMSGRGPMPDRGDVPAGYRNVLEPDAGPEWRELQRRERVYHQ